MYHLEYKKLTKRGQLMKQTIGMTIMKVSSHSLTTKIRGLPTNYLSELGKFADFQNMQWNNCVGC